MSIQIRFFERASLGKTISDPKGNKLWYPFLIFSSLLSTTSIVHEGLRVKTFGSFFLYKYILAGSNIEMSIQIRFFERASLGKTISDPKGNKLWYFFLKFFVFVVYNQYCSWRLKSENFWVTFFCTSISLRGLISKCRSKYVFLNVHPWEKPFQTPRAKNYRIFLKLFGLCCLQPVLFMKA